jgi:hypothetical protein
MAGAPPDRAIENSFVLTSRNMFSDRIIAAALTTCAIR